MLPLHRRVSALALTAVAGAALSVAGAWRTPPSAAINPLTDFARDAGGAAREGQSLRQYPRPRVQRIAILPDRTTGRDWGLPYLDAAVEDLNIVRPDAVFNVGDMIQGYTTDPAPLLLGCGASAIGSTPEGFVQNEAEERRKQAEAGQRQQAEEKRQQAETIRRQQEAV